MAERRMIHKKASVSSDLAMLREKQGPDALAFFLLMIPHLDRWGCVPDNPVTLRGMVVPLWEEITSKDVKKWCDWCVKRGMLERITGPDGDKGLRSPDFHEHQRGTEFAKESPSPFEPTDITARWTRNPRNAGGSPTSRRPVADQSPSGRHERKGREGNEIPSPSVPSGEGGAGEGSSPARPGLGASRATQVVDGERRQEVVPVPASAVDGELGGVVASILERVRLREDG